MAPRPDPRPDREVLAAHVAGEAHAFDELVRRYADRLWSFAARTLDDQHEASDVLQEAFLAAFRSAGGYRAEASVSTWLHRIVLNACFDRLRRARVRAAEPIGDHDVPTPRDPVADHLTRLTVAEALARVPLPQRLAVVLVDVQGFSVAEAAVILGVREGTVKSRCARGRLRLSRLLGHLRPADAGGPVDAVDGDGAGGRAGRDRDAAGDDRAGDGARGTRRRRGTDRSADGGNGPDPPGVGSGEGRRARRGEGRR